MGMVGERCGWIMGGCDRSLELGEGRMEDGRA